MRVTLAALAVLAMAPPAHALGTARQGVGIGLGMATVANGVSLKVMAGPGALQAVAGLWGGGGSRRRFSRAAGLAFGADYLFEMPSLARTEFFTLDWSFGLGAGMGVRSFSEKFALAGSGVAGLEFNFTAVPLDVTIEYRPTLQILSDVDLELIDFTAHVRLWF
jgi:hypothetical protein